ncbi:MAG TPA: hypothetical protein VGD41_06150, partial [Pyrinomonadaceae bacterium]
MKQFRRIQPKISNRPMSKLRLSVFASCLCLLPAAPGQTPPANQDPLMSLMMSQPRIDLSGPVTATSSFDPPTVRPGEKSLYRVSFNALDQMVEWPATIAAPSQLSITPGAHGQIMQPTSAATLQPRATFNSRVTASDLGHFTIPSFVVQVDGNPITVPAARLDVVANPPPLPFAPRMQLEIQKTNLVLGESVN